MKKSAMVLIIFALGLMVHFQLYADDIGSARISLLEGDVLVQTQDTETEWMAASINLPLLSGDRIWVPENARSEIQFLGGACIRADKNTGLDITKLNRDAEGSITQVAVNQGRTYIHYPGPADGNSVFQVDTPFVSAMAYSSAIFDVYVFEDGYTEVSVIKGTVFVEGQHGNTKIDAGDMVSARADNYAGLSPRRTNDAWLNWNMSRDSLFAGRGTSVKYLPSALHDFSADFDEYGHWVHTPDYGYVWSPRITVSTWAPYGNGRWVWRNHDYVWVSYEPWGWAPYHYGRWAFTAGIGWFWVPPEVNDVFWGPGFVAWISTPTYVSWVPLAPREIYYGYGHYGRHSINITKVNIRNIKVTNVYLNTRVSHAVTVVHHDTFTRGKHFNVGNAPANPFLAGLRVSTGRPAIKQINYSALPLKVVQRKNLPAKDNKRTEELGRRNVALNKNISVFKQTKPVTPMSVNVIRDRKSNSLDKDLQQSRPKTNPQISKQAKRQEAGTTVLSGNSVRRVEPRSFPQVNNQAKRQEPRTATPSSSIIRPLEPRTDPQVSKQARPPKSGISNPPSKTVHRPEPGTVPQVKQAQRQESGNNSAQDNIQPRRQESKPAPNLSKNEKHEQRKEKKI